MMTVTQLQTMRDNYAAHLNDASFGRLYKLFVRFLDLVIEDAKANPEMLTDLQSLDILTDVLCGKRSADSADLKIPFVPAGNLSPVAAFNLLKADFMNAVGEETALSKDGLAVFMYFHNKLT